MTSNIAADQSQPSLPKEREFLDDFHRRLVRVHAALAERTNREVGEIMPWTLGELMTLIQDVQAARSHTDAAI